MKTKTYFNIDKLVGQDCIDTQHDLLTALQLLEVFSGSHVYQFDKDRAIELLNRYR
jgi:hypothetical protein